MPGILTHHYLPFIYNIHFMFMDMMGNGCEIFEQQAYYQTNIIYYQRIIIINYQRIYNRQIYHESAELILNKHPTNCIKRDNMKMLCGRRFVLSTGRRVAINIYGQALWYIRTLDRDPTINQRLLIFIQSTNNQRFNIYTINQQHQRWLYYIYYKRHVYT